jgi:hypothetical protein
MVDCSCLMPRAPIATDVMWNIPLHFIGGSNSHKGY